MSIKRYISDVEIPLNGVVRIKEMGNITELLYASKRSKGGYITKISKDEFVDNRTGEIRTFCHAETRNDDIESVQKSIVKLRDVLNTNVTIPQNCRWLTLTYADNMQDTNRLRKDFATFNRRCRKKYGRYEYIAVIEPQGRGAWHIHVVLIYPHHAPYMDNADVRELWRQGFVSVKKLENIDNVGAYLTAYLTDISIEDYQVLHPDTKHIGEIKIIDIIDKDGKTVPKRYIKGGRLSLYPAGCHLFRCSAGIAKPITHYDTYANAKSSLGTAALTYKRTKRLEAPDSDFSCSLSWEIYNSKWKGKKYD